jgi:6-phosphogluconolactonase (cycloisomerase 2 family)
VESNISAPASNSILAYSIADDGSLNPLPGSPFLTDGTGFYDSSFKLGPFDNDQNIILDRDRDILWAVNGGSNTITAFRLGKNGKPTLLPGSPFLSHGSTPVSLGLHDHTLLSVNSAEDPAQAGSGDLPSLTVFALKREGRAIYAPDSSFTFPGDANPTQVLTTNTGPFVFVAEFPGGGMLRAFYQVPDDGRLAPTDKVTPPVENGVQALPLGLWASPKAHILYVGFVNTNQLGIYSWNDLGQLSFVRAVANSGQALCWIRATRDGRYVYTVNTGDHSISVYDASDPASPVEIQHVIVGGVGGLEEFSLDPQERFLYVLEQENSATSVGKSGKVQVLKIDPATGLLTLLDGLTVTLPLPPHTRPLGVAIR